MKTKNVIIEVICFLLLVNFFYQGIYIFAYFKNYSIWLHGAPYLKSVSLYFIYVIPSLEIVLAILLWINGFRLVGLIATLVSFTLFIGYIMAACLFSPLLFWPFHAYWAHAHWIGILIFTVSLAWLNFIAILLYTNNRSRFLSESPATLVTSRQGKAENLF